MPIIPEYHTLRVSAPTCCGEWRHNWVVPPGGSTENDLVAPPGGSSEIDLVATEHYVYDGLAGRTSQVRTSLNTSGYEWRTNFGYNQLGDLSSIGVDPVSWTARLFRRRVRRDPDASVYTFQSHLRCPPLMLKAIRKLPRPEQG